MGPGTLAGQEGGGQGQGGKEHRGALPLVGASEGTVEKPTDKHFKSW